jgi:hypothetical protein
VFIFFFFFTFSLCYQKIYYLPLHNQKLQAFGQVFRNFLSFYSFFFMVHLFCFCSLIDIFILPYLFLFFFFCFFFLSFFRTGSQTHLPFFLILLLSTSVSVSFCFSFFFFYSVREGDESGDEGEMCVCDREREGRKEEDPACGLATGLGGRRRRTGKPRSRAGDVLGGFFRRLCRYPYLWKPNFSLGK